MNYRCWVRVSIQQANLISQTANTALIFSNIIGNNLGPYLSSRFGSLAILMWMGVMSVRELDIFNKGLFQKSDPSYQSLKLSAAALVLWLEVFVFHMPYQSNC